MAENVNFIALTLQSEDMEFWLSGSDVANASKDSSPLPPETPPGPPTPEKHVRLNLDINELADNNEVVCANGQL